jgi:hypothetical protein
MEQGTAPYRFNTYQKLGQNGDFSAENRQKRA